MAGPRSYKPETRVRFPHLVLVSLNITGLDDREIWVSRLFRDAQDEGYRVARGFPAPTDVEHLMILRIAADDHDCVEGTHLTALAQFTRAPREKFPHG